jgi:hypothetical protein
MRPMSQLPITEPAETRITEPDGSIEALAAATTGKELTAVAARFPTCLAAAALGERDEDERCAKFLADLAPDAPAE